MSDKPSYLGLLNALAVGEARAGVYYKAWADTTPDPDVRKVLLTVAARESEHGASFTKRINELGFEVREKEDDRLDKAMEIVTSDCSDLEKMEALGVSRLGGESDEADAFDTMFRDHSIDPTTGALLGRYIAEERDTGRLLTGCCGILTQRANGADAASDDRLSALEDKIDAVCSAVDQIRDLVMAQAPGTNGKPARAVKAGAK
jgi:rubrerythrin